MGNPDTYYNRTEVSNSDLTELKNMLYPRLQYGDKEKIFAFGSLVDALVTEPARVNRFQLTVDDVKYTEDDFRLAMEIQKSLVRESRRDEFLAYVLNNSDTQKFMVREREFEYCGFSYTLPTRCKWDWWLPKVGFGGDLKTTFAVSQSQFDEAVDFFDWDRSRAWYMDIAGSSRDFIYAVSKKNCKVFKKFIERGDRIYSRGREKYDELAFKYYLFIA